MFLIHLDDAYEWFATNHLVRQVEAEFERLGVAGDAENDVMRAGWANGGIFLAELPKPLRDRFTNMLRAAVTQLLATQDIDTASVAKLKELVALLGESAD